MYTGSAVKFTVTDFIDRANYNKIRKKQRHYFSQLCMIIREKISFIYFFCIFVNFFLVECVYNVVNKDH